MTATLPNPDLLLAANPAIATAVAGTNGMPGGPAQPQAGNPASPHGSFASTLRTAQGANPPTAPPNGSQPLPGTQSIIPLPGTPPAPAASATLLNAAPRQTLAGNSLPETGSSLPLIDTATPAVASVTSSPTTDSAGAELLADPQIDSDPAVSPPPGDSKLPASDVGTTAALPATSVAPPAAPTPATSADVERPAAGVRTESAPSVVTNPDGNRGASTNLNDGTQSNGQRDYRPDSGEPAKAAPDSARTIETTQTASARTATFSLDVDGPAGTGTMSSETRTPNPTPSDPTGAQQRPLQPGADPQRWSNGLGERLVMMAENGTQTARVKLHPEHLGPLDVRITVEDDTARVWFGAQHAQTREALEAALPRLREMLAEQGLELLHADIDAGEQHRQNDDGDFAEQAGGTDAAVEQGAHEITAGMLSRAAPLSPRLVDIYA